MKSKLTVYLGDPVHNFVPSNDIWTVPLNICDIAAYALSIVSILCDMPSRKIVALSQLWAELIYFGLREDDTFHEGIAS